MGSRQEEMIGKGKRPLVSDVPAMWGPGSGSTAEAQEDTHENGNTRARSGEQLLEEAEKEVEKEAGKAPRGDARTAKKLAERLEEKAAKNQHLRAQNAGHPERFVDSEVDLDESIREVRQVAAEPGALHGLAEGSIAATALSLTGHENADIASNALELMAELLDVGEEPSQEAAKGAARLAEDMVESGMAECSAQALAALDESTEEGRTGWRACLSVLEAAGELIEGGAARLAQGDGGRRLARLLVGRVRAGGMDEIHLQASEVLGLLLASDEGLRAGVAEEEAIESLLQAVSAFKEAEPQSMEEEEVAANVFDCLCSLMLDGGNKQKLVEAEGLELCLLIARRRGGCAKHALKLVDFALNRCPPACERFVDLLGLRVAFAALMGKLSSARKRKRKREDREEDESEESERGLSIIASLLSCLPQGDRRERALAKLADGDYEKVDRLFDLYEKFKDLSLGANIPPEADAEDAYLLRLEAGLAHAQNAALILAHAWRTADGGVRGRMRQILRLRNLSLEQFRNDLLELADNIGDVGGEDERQRRRERTLNLCQSFAEPGEFLPQVHASDADGQPTNGDA